MHERHVLLEAHMRAARKAAELEEEQLKTAESQGDRRESQRGSQVPQTGERLRVTIVRASGFRGPDWTGKSAPYCVCQIPNKRRAKFETAVVERSVTPEWNETHEIPNYEEGDPLSFAVLDRDVDRGEALGRATLPGSELRPQFEGEVRLSSPNRAASGDVAGVLWVKVQVIGADGEPIAKPAAFLKASGSPTARRQH